MVSEAKVKIYYSVIGKPYRGKDFVPHSVHKMTQDIFLRLLFKQEAVARLVTLHEANR